MKSKNILSSVTVWAAILSLWLGISPTVKTIIVEGYNGSLLIDIIDNVVATLLVIIGRYNSDSVLFTPRGFPGRNKETLTQEK